jgi:Integrase core domain
MTSLQRVEAEASYIGKTKIAGMAKLCFIRPRHPVENGFIEGINGRLRGECLSVESFSPLVSIVNSALGNVPETNFASVASQEQLPLAHNQEIKTTIFMDSPSQRQQNSRIAVSRKHWD